MQTSLKLINGTIQDLYQINIDIPAVPNWALLFQIVGPTYFILDNIRVNNTILYSNNSSIPRSKLLFSL